MVTGAPTRRASSSVTSRGGQPTSARQKRARVADRLHRGQERRKRGTELIGRSNLMLALLLACLVVLAGCIIDNHPVRVENFTADTPVTFTYDTWTNTMMTVNDDGAAEQIRRDWLAEVLTAHGMCAAGYAVETGRLLTSSGRVPALEQRSRSAMNRVAGGQRDGSDPRHRPRVIRLAEPAHVGTLSARVGADDEEDRASSFVLVSDTGRDHNNI